MQVSHVLESCLYVDDLAKAEHFYTQVLDLAVESRQEGRHVFFHCGSQMLLLFNPLASRDSAGDFPRHGAFGPGHLAFGIFEADLPAWIDRLEYQGVAIEKVIEWPRG